jgi:hypothetical protein
MRISGGCHCGQVRFGGEAEILWAGHCHCRDCQLTSGAPFVTWVTIPAGAIQIDGEPTLYRSSERGRRRFCPRCGALLFWEGRPDRIDIAVACLDEPDSIRPGHNSFVRSRLAFMKGFDSDLPSHLADAPD